MNEKKILVTGGSGLLGNAFKSLIPNAMYPTSYELDLSSTTRVQDFINKYRPETIIHLAAKVGGVKANIDYMFDFYQANSEINNNIFYSSVLFKVPKVVTCLSTCVYPDKEHVVYPLTEEQLHFGPPHESNFAYSYVKRMVDVQTRAIRKQHNLKYISVIPNNLYGEHDNFHLEDSHVIPALMRKIWEAKINNKPHFEVWGDGKVYREFTYAKDIAKAILFCLENYNDDCPINIGNTDEYCLRDVVEIIKKEFDYRGEVKYNLNKPKGQTRKPSSNQKLLDLGWKKENYIPLKEGLKKTCEWFKINYPDVRGMN